MKNATLRQLRVFAAVARHLSFVRAAEELHLTPPAVSMQVKELESEVGLPLFDRSGRSVSLTTTGEYLLAYTRRLLAVFKDAEDAVARFKGLAGGQLTVGMVSTAKYFLPRLLGAFCQRFPDIRIALEIGNREKIVARLRDNLDDLYIMSYPPEDLDIVVHPFLDNELVVVAPTGHWAASATTPMTLADLAREPFLLREEGSGSRRAIDEFAAREDLRLQVRLSLASNEAIRDLVASGMGLAVLSRHALGGHLDEQGLVELSVRGFPLRRPWNVVHLRSKILPLPAQAFLDELRRTGKDPAP